jgi:hypothetical protein
MVVDPSYLDTVVLILNSINDTLQAWSECMSPYELADLAQSAFGNGISAFGIFLSLVTAYLAVAYLVGKKITGTQTGILTTLFLTTSGIAGFAVAAYTKAGMELNIRAFPNSSDQPFGPKLWLVTAIVIICIFSLAMCLKFMRDVRRQSNGRQK